MAPTPSWCGTDNGETFVQFIVVCILYYNRSDSEHYIEVTEASLQDFAGYIQTWSGFQKYKEVHGDANAEAVIAEFLSE